MTNISTSIARLLCFCMFLAVSANLTGQTFPAGFSQTKIGNVYYPTAMTKTPDGRIFVCEKGGRVKVIKNGVVLSTPFLQVSVEEMNERGLSGIAIDPSFNTNHYVYIYYTTSNPVHNRLSRFTANGDVAVPGSEVKLIDFEPVVNSIHNGGGMAFGPDGKLYLAMGDDKVSSNAQSLSTHKGKLLRLNKDGTAPADNPFTGSVPASRIWAYGFRNPYSIDIQPGTGKIFVNDVGESSWEEINNATVAGKNFGWPGAEGNSNNTSYTNPVLAYAHGNTNTTGCGISGGAFFNPSSTNYPSMYVGKYFFIDYCNDWINYIDPSGGSAVNFASNLAGAGVGVLTGNDGNLYYLSISQSALYRITYNGGSAPVITQQPVSQTVSQGQTARFTVGASGAAPLNYQWYKNNAAIAGATSATLNIQNAQASNQGQYKVTVSNGSGNTTSNTVSLTVTGFNAPPQAAISTPAAGTYYRGGDVISYSGSGTDPEDGTLAAANFTWVIDFHHAQHVHPGPTGAMGSKTGSFVIPQTGESSSEVFYRLHLIVRDSQNRTDTVSRDIYPHKTKITIASVPPGLQVALEGQPSATTFTAMAVENMKFDLNAITPQTKNGSTYAFTGWAHGGPANQTITIPVNDFTYTATYTNTGNSSCSASGTILREYWSNVASSTLADIPFHTAPSGSSQITRFEGPTGFGDNYGSRIRGYICPPATGNYTFWIASDNSSELYLSTDENPANKVKRAAVNGYTKPREYNKYPEQKSAPVYLVAGQKYYIEAIHREKAEGDNLSVGWTLPSGTAELPIPGTRLSPFEPALSVVITSPANNSAFTAGSNITVNASATSGTTSISKVEFYANGQETGEDLSAPYSIIWNNVPAGTHQLSAKVTGQNNQSAASQTVTITAGNVAGCSASGSITREVWTNVSGASVKDIPTGSTPALTQQLTLFKAPSNFGDNYGQRIRGFICPPASGNYTFWIASDDNSELWLSTNDNAANRQLIAYVNGWTTSGDYSKYASQRSAPVNLMAGQKYYIEALHKEGTQGDNLAVGWQIPGGALERPIPGNRLSPYSAPVTVNITSPANNSSYSPGANIAINATAGGGSGTIARVEFFSGNTKLGEDLSAPYTFAWNNVAAGTYTLSAKATDNNNLSSVSAPVVVKVGSEASCSAEGKITREVWYNVEGTTVSSIPFGTTPGTTEQINIFQAPSEIGDHYGQRVRGYICAPFSGSYEFFIASDDNSELWLSTDTTTGNKRLVASVSGWTFPGEWTKYPSQKSALITLTAGKKYYIEALHKEGDQGDHMAVGWKLPNGTLQQPIPGSYLSPFISNAPTSICEASVRPGGSTTFCEGGSVTLYSNTGPGYSYQWKKNGTNITGATGPSYSTNSAGDYQVKIYYTGCQAWSPPVNVTVNDYLTARITAGGPTSFCEGGSVTLFGNTCEGYIYQWKRNDADIPGANAPNYVATVSGDYQLKIVHGSSINWSSLVRVTVDPCGSARSVLPDTAMADTSQPDEQKLATQLPENKDAINETFKLKLYPNPTTGLFTFDFCLEEVSEDEMLVRVVSASSGQEVYRRGPTRISGCVKGNIDLPANLSTGVYVLQLTIGQKTESTKLILYR